MRIFPRLTQKLPATVASMLGIPPGERVIAWGSSRSLDGTQSTFTAATDQALYVQAAGERIPWERIAKATWDEPELALVVLDDAGRQQPLMRVRVDESRDLPAAVHDRVTASVIVSERVDLGDGRGALMVARRTSGSSDAAWTVVFDAGLDPSDPDLRAAAGEALARLRGSLGI